ncbi:helix-turn-helix domain-containing protein [Amycolatopsis samaneae]|uniref:Helix-turn-helix domain-containing protein n=1 Tax=Amycolatopsis samaneae TaxID=664691 RepID=A0ABW5GCB4_9PSEU
MGSGEEPEIASAEAFGARLRELRGRLTQETVARRSVLGRAALTRQRVSNIENGLLPSADQLRCYLHGCGQPELFDRLDAVRGTLESTSDTTVEKAPERPASGLRRGHLVLGAVVVAVAASAAAVITVLNRSAQPVSVVVPACAPGSICFWPEPDFGGEKLQWPPDWEQDGRQCVPLPFTARSVMNASTERQWGYASGDCTGPRRTLLQHNNGLERSVTINSYIKT